MSTDHDQLQATGHLKVAQGRLALTKIDFTKLMTAVVPLVYADMVLM